MADVGHVRIHDIRRTLGLHVDRKAVLHIASKLLRQPDIRVTERHYGPLGFDELRKTLYARSVDFLPINTKKRGRRKKSG